MPTVLTDSEIQALIDEPKHLTDDWRRRLVTKPKRGHTEGELEITGTGGTQFRLILRRSLFNHLDFSAILGFIEPTTGRVFRLRRYNGKSHEHTNPIESQTFYDFHIHYSTERYQLTGNREDTFPTPTDRYSSLDQATECLLLDCGVVLPDSGQMALL